MKTLALLMIRGYQRCLSPYKGYRCAYSVHTGRCGCSGIGYRAIRLYGLVQGLGVLRERLAVCSHMHHTHMHRTQLSARPVLSKQAGVCDVGCVDVGSCDIVPDSQACNYVSCCDCGSWGDSKKNKPKKERGGLFVNSR
jgi:uncharacterized protein